jgi:hypothetical protein
LGFAVRRVGAAAHELEHALDGCELVVVDNVCAMPAHVRTETDRAIEAIASRGHHVVFHHRELPWQPGSARHDSESEPPRTAGALHTTVSLRARHELYARNYRPVAVIHDHFDFDVPSDAGAATRAITRAAHGFADGEIVLYQPTAATTNTNVAGAVRFAGALHAIIPNQPVRYWLRGPIDADVARIVEQLLERCEVPVTIGTSAAATDAFAAADAVLVPSTWDSSGNVAIAAIVARRPCVVGTFPVRGELEAVGLRFFGLDEPVELVKFLARPDDRRLDTNLRRARLSFNVEDLPAQIDAALTAVGGTTGVTTGGPTGDAHDTHE